MNKVLTINLLPYLLLILLASCNGSPSTSSEATPPAATDPTPSNPTTNPVSHVDNNVQHFIFDVTNGNATSYSSSNTFADSAVFTIPSVVLLDNNSTGSVKDVDNFIELQLVGKISCIYMKNGNVFNFDHCNSFTSSVYWTVKSGDTYTVTDLNADSTVPNKNKIMFVIWSIPNNVMNGHITFSYDL